MRDKRLQISTVLLLAFGLIELQAQTSGTFTDSRDGKEYKTVTIGALTIMAENLSYKPDSGVCLAYNDDSVNVLKYGYLYDLKTAISVASSTSGWHLPTLAEWEILQKYFAGIPPADIFPGGKSGFDALFGGYYSEYDGYRALDRNAYFWIDAEIEDEASFGIYIYESDLGLESYNSNNAYSVRLIKNE